MGTVEGAGRSIRPESRLVGGHGPDGRTHAGRAGLERAISSRLALLDIDYLVGASTSRAAIAHILADLTNDVILFGHGIVPAHGAPAQDFMVMSQEGESALVGGGYSIQAQTFSLVGCQTSTVPLSMNGAITTTDIYSNQAAIFRNCLRFN
jgi:hypothetical protein